MSANSKARIKGVPSKAAKTPRSKTKWNWLRRLDNGDRIELLKWVEQSGPERVARIIATLAERDGTRGQPDELETLLLLKVAHMKRARPDKTLHAIAKEIGREAHPDRRRGAETSLVSKLERDFRKSRHTWMNLAATTPLPSRESISREVARPKSNSEDRILARIVGLLPSAIDLYDELLCEAERRGPDEAALVKALGRERAEPLLGECLRRQQTSSFVLSATGSKKIPRSLFDLVEADLERFRQGRTHRRSVGRK